MTADLDDLLASEPLPPIDGDKKERGGALVVAGDLGCPGAAILAATAALRAGAGRVQIVTHPALATGIGIAVPETLTIGWDGQGAPDPELARRAREAAAVLIGPGLGDRAVDTARSIAQLVPRNTPVLLDAGSLPAAPDIRDHPLIVLPNTDEAHALADALGLDDRRPVQLATDLARRLAAVVAVRGPMTFLSDGQQAWQTAGHAALGTAGSGDVLTGLVTGLAARGLEPLSAAAWAIAIHGQAGSHLGGPEPRTGYLARDLLEALHAAVDQINLRIGSDERRARLA